MKSKDIEGIQFKGGSILGTGGENTDFDAESIMRRLKHKQVKHLYVIGDTLNSSFLRNLSDALDKAKLQIQIVCIPASIDNDLPIFDRSFGFQTAVAQSVPFITAANVEAEAAELGVGIVRIMGEQCGNFAAAAALASLDCNICLVPEIRFQLFGKNGVYESILERAQVKGHCIIIVAEGAYNGLIESDKEEIRQANNGLDIEDLASFIKSNLNVYA